MTIQASTLASCPLTLVKLQNQNLETSLDIGAPNSMIQSYLLPLKTSSSQVDSNTMIILPHRMQPCNEGQFHLTYWEKTW